MTYITEKRNEDTCLAGWLLTVRADDGTPAGVCCTYDRAGLICVELSALRVYPEFQRQGYGSLLMRHALSLYDEDPREVKLSVIPYHKDKPGGMSRTQLFEWYASFGFRRVSYDETEDWAPCNLMVRGTQCLNVFPTSSTLMS